MSSQSEHDRRAEIHTRTENATKGPWKVDDGPFRKPNVVRQAAELIDSIGVCGQRLDMGPVFTGQVSSRSRQGWIADAEFIANAISDVPWLLDLVDAKDTALEEQGWELAAAHTERDCIKAERDRLVEVLARVRHVANRARWRHSDPGGSQAAYDLARSVLSALDGEVPDGN